MILLRIIPQKSFLKKAPMDFFNYTGKRRKKQPFFKNLAFIPVVKLQGQIYYLIPKRDNKL